MECVLKVIQNGGAEASADPIRCTDAETVIGRSPRSQVRIQHASISFEHAILTRIGDAFYLENLSASGTWLNDQRMTAKLRIRAKDRIRIGQNTVIRVESVPAAASDEGRRRVLLFTILFMIVAALVIIFVDPFSTVQTSVNWSPVYSKLDTWVDRQANEHLLPGDVKSRLEQAWRLHVAGDRTSAAQEWLRLQILLSEQSTMAGATQSVSHRRQALSALIHPKDPTSTLADEDMGAALIQFVADMTRHG